MCNGGGGAPSERIFAVSNANSSDSFDYGEVAPIFCMRWSSSLKGTSKVNSIHTMFKQPFIVYFLGLLHAKVSSYGLTAFNEMTF
jgi:hypothetical protein